MIHKNAAHQACGKAVEVFAIFKAQAALLNQLEVEFVDDAGGLQKVFGPLAAKQRTGDLPELRVDQIEEVIERGRIATPPFVQEHRNFARIGQRRATL